MLSFMQNKPAIEYADVEITNIYVYDESSKWINISPLRPPASPWRAILERLDLEGVWT